MATYYVSPSGSDTSPYDTWAKAAIKLSTIAAIDVAGDTVYVDSTAACPEGAMGSDLSLAWAGTRASPTRILSADPAHGNPPSQLTVGAAVTATGNFSFKPLQAANFSAVYVYGTIFQSGVYLDGGTGTLAIATSGEFHLVCDMCKFRQDGNNSGNLVIGINNSPHTRIELINCAWRVAHASSVINIIAAANSVFIRGMTYETGAFTACASAFSGTSATWYGLDLSALPNTVALVPSGTGTLLRFADCRLPSGWTGTVGASPNRDGRIEATCVDETGTNYRLSVLSFTGTINSETTIIRTSGATDGVTGLSWKMVTNNNAIGFLISSLASQEIIRWNNTVGSPITATIEILHDSATALNDDEIWLECTYLGASGSPLASFLTDAKASVLASAAAQTASSATWTTTGMSNPNTQKLSVTFTPQLKGFIHAVVKVCKASKTVYICPKLEIS
jgi:hypothetical protein